MASFDAPLYKQRLATMANVNTNAISLSVTGGSVNVVAVIAASSYEDASRVTARLPAEPSVATINLGMPVSSVWPVRVTPVTPTYKSPPLPPPVSPPPLTPPTLPSPHPPAPLLPPPAAPPPQIPAHEVVEATVSYLLIVAIGAVAALILLLIIKMRCKAMKRSARSRSQRAQKVDLEVKQAGTSIENMANLQQAAEERHQEALRAQAEAKHAAEQEALALAAANAQPEPPALDSEEDLDEFIRQMELKNEQNRQPKPVAIPVAEAAPAPAESKVPEVAALPVSASSNRLQTYIEKMESNRRQMPAAPQDASQGGDGKMLGLAKNGNVGESAVLGTVPKQYSGRLDRARRARQERMTQSCSNSSLGGTPDLASAPAPAPLTGAAAVSLPDSLAVATGAPAAADGGPLRDLGYAPNYAGPGAPPKRTNSFRDRYLDAARQNAAEAAPTRGHANTSILPGGGTDIVTDDDDDDEMSRV